MTDPVAPRPGRAASAELQSDRPDHLGHLPRPPWRARRTRRADARGATCRSSRAPSRVRPASSLLQPQLQATGPMPGPLRTRQSQPPDVRERPARATMVATHAGPEGRRRRPTQQCSPPAVRAFSAGERLSGVTTAGGRARPSSPDGWEARLPPALSTPTPAARAQAAPRSSSGTARSPTSWSGCCRRTGRSAASAATASSRDDSDGSARQAVTACSAAFSAPRTASCSALARADHLDMLGHAPRAAGRW